jgi:hypothetical protein
MVLFDFYPKFFRSDQSPIYHPAYMKAKYSQHFFF